MKRGAAIIAAGLLSLTALSWWAGIVGALAPEPVKSPPSIREGSVRGAVVSGRAGTRYFVGGGLHRGK